jgi:uncharacterized RDD family membrane protein YckC
MKKRVFATVVWFYAAWYAGAIIAELLGVTALIGPIVAVVTAAFVAWDPGHLFSPHPEQSVGRRQAAAPATFEADRLT